MKGLLKIVLGEVIDPITRRLGTALAAYLVALGVQAQTVDAIVLGLTALAGVGVDLLLSHFERTRRVAK